MYIYIHTGVDKTLIRKVAQTFALVVPACTLLSLSVATDLTPNQAIGMPFRLVYMEAYRV
jgi:hypothetical protein